VQRVPTIAARGLLILLFAVSVYRAVTQSIVYDEALTWELYIAGPFSAIFQHFDANHHFLNTLLMRLSTGIFGVSEWSMRLPALGGAALYFTAVDRVSRRAFGEGWTSLLAVALLSLNPFVLDFMVAARGYGMGLGLWMWALALVYEQLSLPFPQPRRLLLAGSALALSVTANLIFAPPAAALAGMTIYFLSTKKPPEAAKRRKQKQPARKGTPWIWFAGPIVVIAVVFLLLAPVEDIKAEQLYTGANSIAESLRSLASVSLEHSGPLRSGKAPDLWRDAVAFGIAPLILAAGFALGLRRRSLWLILAAGTAVFSAVALLLIHVVLGTPYPADRTGIYFLPLVTLVLIGLARMVPVAPYVLGGLFVLLFAAEFNTRKFYVWDYDADTRTIGEYIAAHRDPSAAVTRVGGSWQLQESLQFYGYKNQWTWMELTNRPAPGMDYYALIPQDRAVATGSLGLKTLYRGAVSQSVLASVSDR
jgi:4-amino-4-deoxy-L-arabinose transferase-like glycosyltransferase